MNSYQLPDSGYAGTARVASVSTWFGIRRRAISRGTSRCSSTNWPSITSSDVGANTGQYGQLLRRIGYTGKITSFEPVSATFAKLQATIAGDSEWNTRNFALGAEQGVATIHVTRWLGVLVDAGPKHTPAGLGRSMSSTIVAKKSSVHRLDEIYTDVVQDESSVLLKLDTQGWDLVVLEGADRLSRQTCAAIQTEVSVIPLYEKMPTWIDSMSWIDELGFQPTGLFPVTYADGFRSLEFDLVATRPMSRSSVEDELQVDVGDGRALVFATGVLDRHRVRSCCEIRQRYRLHDVPPLIRAELLPVRVGVGRRPVDAVDGGVQRLRRGEPVHVVGEIRLCDAGQVDVWQRERRRSGSGSRG